MTKSPNSSITEQDYQKNIELSYDYIEKSLKEVQDINNNTNTQLGVLIGFNFTFIRFFLNELLNKIINIDNLLCYSCLLLKILAYGFSIASIISCFIGLYKNVIYSIIYPKALIENGVSLSNEELRLAIIDTWEEKFKSFKEVNEQKKQMFNRSIILLLISGIAAIINKLIVSIFY
ncbi:MAG: hypothetical protein QNJ33_09835 [Crocosphaera sp.]|nr:hypothetical protein [Crocosphaera sp.]